MVDKVCKIYKKFISEDILLYKEPSFKATYEKMGLLL